MDKKNEKDKLLKMKGELKLGMEKDEVKFKGKMYLLAKIKLIHAIRFTKNCLIAAVIVSSVVGAYWYAQ